MNPFSPDAFFEFSDSRVYDLFKDINHVWDAVAILPSYIRKILKPEVLGEVEEGGWIESGLVRLEKGSRVERGAIVRGPTIIGRDTVIRTGAYIRGDVMIGNECVIGCNTEIRQILVLNQSNIAHLNVVCTSLVGNRVNIAGNTHTANYRLDGKEVVIRIDVEGNRQTFPTGQIYFGAVIGDDVKTGGSSILMPATIVGQRSIIYPQCSVSGYIPHDSLVKPVSRGFEVISQTENK